MSVPVSHSFSSFIHSVSIIFCKSFGFRAIKKDEENDDDMICVMIRVFHHSLSLYSKHPILVMCFEKF